jgi:hypothetical protein
MNSMFNDLFIIFTLVRLHILSNNMLKHINPDLSYVILKI